MKKFVRENKITLIILIALILFGAFSVFQYSNEWNKMYQQGKDVIAQHPELNLKLSQKEDTYNVFLYVMINSNLRFIQLISPILVLIPGIFALYNDMKSGIYKDIIMRKKYDKYMKKSIIKSWLPALIIPIFLISTFIFSYIFSGHFDINNTFAEYGTEMTFPTQFMSNPVLYIVIYVVNLGLLGIFYINVGIFFIKKNNNFILTVVFSFLTILAYQIITEVFLGYMLASLFNNALFNNVFSLFNLWLYDGVFNLQSEVIYVISLVILSTITLYFAYIKKEGVIIENEK